MGFSVTASVIIFAIALLGAFSAASSAYWKNQSTIEAAQRTANERAIKAAHASLAISNVVWDGVGSTETFRLTNAGTVAFDDSLFQFMFDGNVTFQAQSAGYPKLNGADPASSALLLPGDTFDCRFDLASQPSNVMVISEFGNVYAHSP